MAHDADKIHFLFLISRVGIQSELRLDTADLMFTCILRWAKTSLYLGMGLMFFRLVKRGHVTTYAHESTIPDIPWGALVMTGSWLSNAQQKSRIFDLGNCPRSCSHGPLTSPSSHIFLNHQFQRPWNYQSFLDLRRRQSFEYNAFNGGIHRRWQVIQLSLHHLVT